jgi:hypothetical protein
MVFPPGFPEQLPVFLDHQNRPPNIPVGQTTLRQNLECLDIDPRLTIPVNMNMRRFMICRVDHEPQSMLAKDGDHEGQ